MPILPETRPPAQSLREYGRGIAGGLIFSIPLLFTMEVWWASFLLEPRRLLLYVLGSFALLLAYNRFAGLREDASWWECAIDSVEEMGIGLVLGALMLWLLGRLDASGGGLEIVGKIIMEGMTVAVGVSVGTAQLGTDQAQGAADAPSDDSADDDSADDEDWGDAGGRNGDARRVLAQVAVAFCGAILFVSGVAPTEEILVVASEAAPVKLLFIALLSLLLGALVLFFSEFRGSGSEVSRGDGFTIVRGVLATYAVALVASASALFFFGRFDGESGQTIFAQTIVAALVAAMGASAGRLLLQSNSDD